MSSQGSLVSSLSSRRSLVVSQMSSVSSRRRPVSLLMRSRSPMMRSRRYPTDLATGTTWVVDTIDSWILSEDGEIADIVSQLLVQEGFEGIADAITVHGRIDAAMLSEKIQELSGGHTVVPRKKIETSIQEWRVATDLAVRLNYPHCQLPDTNAHYRHYCTEPSVVAARRTRKELLTAAIYSCELEKTTAAALTAMYMLDTQGKHVDPGATENENCDDLVEGLIVNIGEKIRPAKTPLVALL